MKPAKITEGGLLLRPWEPTDADAVHRACQDPDIQRWTTVPSPYLPEHAEGFVTEVAPAAWANGTGAPFAVCDASTGEVLGSCGLVSINQTLRTGEVGYWTAPWARGRAVAVVATRAVARWAFREHGLRRLIWQAEVGNHASRLVALRAGFRVDGELRLAQPHPRGTADGWIGSLLPSDLAGLSELSDADGDGNGGGAPEGTDGPAAPGSLAARRAAVFGRTQPVLFANAGDGEIRLRRPEARDLDAIVTACRDPETVRWTTVPDPYQRSDAEFYAHEHATGRWTRGQGAVFVIADPDDNFAGTLELRLSAGDPGMADVGYLVAPHARGRGYCSRALAAASAWAFASLGLWRIEWRAHLGNDASRRAAEKAGFTMEGVARQGIPHRGTRVDVWVGALLSSDDNAYREAG
ncbi:GNAT family N-acetyltransferase [Micromonospora sp. NPDC050417]|uniref:GNAT family N-acetyltransferase n=1 Tax=Micromonospora sp. NPDC050417 TaxID=3364280 RepID=UPI0037B40BF1